MGPVAVIANPTSGGGTGGRLLPRVESVLRALGIEHRVVVTRDAGHATLAAAEAVEAGESIVAVGGDGLVGGCAAALVGTDVALVIVPAGAGNDIARNVGLDPRKPLWAIRLLHEGRTRRIDTGLAEGHGWENPFVCVAGAGFDSEANAYANTMTRLHGTPRYVAATLRTLVRFRPARFTIRVDGEEAGGPAMMIAVGNARSYGGGMRVCPDALLDDGALDVCVVGAMSKAEFVTTFPRVFRGTHVQHPAVRTYRGTRIEMEADRPFRVYADGEPLGHLPVTFTVEPRALEVVAP